MKTTTSLLGIALAFGLAMTVHPVSGQPPSGGLSVGIVKEQFNEQERLVTNAAHDFLKTAGTNREERQLARDKLRPLVEVSFTLRQQLQHAELAELRRRLDDIERDIQEREKKKDAVINARLDELLSGGTASKPGIEIGSDAGLGPAVPDGSVQPTAATTTFQRSRPKQGEKSRTSLDDFDIETRELLAQLDLQAAQEEYDAADKELKALRELDAQGAVSQQQIRACEKEHRRATVELKRARTKGEGLARQRAELKVAADAEIAEAIVEEQRAVTMVRAAEAKREAARAQLDKAMADMQAAQATVSYEEKQYQRFKELVDQKAVDANLLLEREEKLAAAKATLLGAKASAETAKAKLDECESAIEVAKLESYRARAHIHAAKDHRDRLTHRDAADTKGPTGPAEPARPDNAEPTP